MNAITAEKNLILVSNDIHFKSLQKIEPRLKIINSKDYFKNIQ